MPNMIFSSPMAYSLVTIIFIVIVMVDNTADYIDEIFLAKPELININKDSISSYIDFRTLKEGGLKKARMLTKRSPLMSALKVRYNQYFENVENQQEEIFVRPINE